MEQKITIKIAGKSYVLKASTPENEQLIRLAAEDVNKKLGAYTASFPGKNLEDILAFVALNECVSRLSFKKKLDEGQAQIAALAEDTRRYLTSIEEK